MPTTISGTAGVNNIAPNTVQTVDIQNSAVTQEKLAVDIIHAQCTAWVNFNGTGTVAIRDSYNVSSITDNGVGNYTVNFATPMNNTNYTPIVSVSAAGGTGGTRAAINVQSGSTLVAPTVNGFVANSLDYNTVGSGRDAEYISVAVFGGK